MTGAATFVSAQELQTCTVRQCLGGGEWGEPRTVTDLRGTPKGDKAAVWEWDRMVLPRPRASRRVREHVKVMHCPEGWYDKGGSAAQPWESQTGALCATLMDPKWSGPGDWRARYHAFHADNPVVWVVSVSRHTHRSEYRFCDPELPDEYRPA